MQLALQTMQQMMAQLQGYHLPSNPTPQQILQVAQQMFQAGNNTETIINETTRAIAVEQTNTHNITINRTDINANTQNITINRTDINTNTHNIAINRTDIDTNTRGISDNRYNIAINSSRISNNSRRISYVEHKIRYINVNDNSSAIGNNAQANAEHAIAIGNNATVDKDAHGGVALGTNTHVKNTATRSVALGEYSVADEAYTVSVGSETIKRRITNVADGINPNDAVNMRQYNFLDTKVNKLDKKVRGVAAMNSAMSALVPNNRVKNDSQVSLGLGQYGGETAFAMGIFHYVDDNILLNAGISYAKESGTAGRAGITWGF